MNTYRYVVCGFVQGVGFRYFVYRHARRMGLRGHVRNLGDGRVEVLATGGEQDLAELERLLARGPASSQVDRVMKEAGLEPAGQTDFLIEV